ncbi:hypothetical protein HMPREF9999_01109 [Alloprevotella sp. oral taxon 473 str. F0040]|nr:hypothetical protein HMPREF9999_01109 [Alloprevotella sp. oral taxon 473 str. F0040]
MKVKTDMAEGARVALRWRLHFAPRGAEKMRQTSHLKREKGKSAWAVFKELEVEYLYFRLNYPLMNDKVTQFVGAKLRVVLRKSYFCREHQPRH